MDVNQICSNSGVQLRPIPEGIRLPDSAELTSDTIETLGEMSWLLTKLQEYLEIHQRILGLIGRPGEDGSMLDSTYVVWGQVTQELVASTGIAAGVLPIEAIAAGVLARLEDNSVNAGDRVRLNQIVELMTDFLSPFQQFLTSGDYPLAGQTAYSSDRSFKHNARNLLEALEARLPEDLRQQIILEEGPTGFQWTPLSAVSIQNVRDQVSGLIASSCESYAADIPEPQAPPIAPPVTPESRLIEYGVTLAPSYAIQLSGDDTSPLAQGPSLYGRAAMGFNISEEMTLQIDYAGLMNVGGFDDFTSRTSHDTGIVTFRYNDWIVQGGYLYENNVILQQEDHLGTAGVGYELFDGLLYPFIGGMFGTGFGGYAGVRSSYMFEGPRIGLTGQVLYSMLYRDELDHQVGGSVASTWSPVSFLGADFQVGVGVNGGYDTLSRGSDINFALLLGLSSDILTPQPIRLGAY